MYLQICQKSFKITQEKSVIHNVYSFKNAVSMVISSHLTYLDNLNKQQVDIYYMYPPRDLGICEITRLRCFAHTQIDICN